MDQLAFAPPQQGPADVSFSGDRAEFRGLVSRGAALELVTIGFYRFWLATDIRRHLWSNTLIGDDAAEYSGRGRELLLGFLIALAIIVPVYLGYFLVGLEVARFKAFASLPLFAFFYLFGQFAIYRARRYRLTRTVWRGVRFWMTGSGWAYAARSALWLLLVILTLGLLLPWREAALERYKMRHCYYGDLQGSFEGKGWDFFKQGWWLWLLPILMIAGPPTIVHLAHLSGKGFPEPAARAITSAGSFIASMGAPFIYGIFKAVEWRWWVSGIRFGEARLKSHLARGALVGLYWKVIGWFLLIFASFGAYLFLCAALVAEMSDTSIAKLFVAVHSQGSIAMLVLAGIGYLAFILIANIVLRVYLLRDVWERVATSTMILHLEAVEDVSAAGELANAIGEGLADGLDVFGF
jgi:uncharacterized membrane protein YjgN (DUF898 family)